VSQADEAGVYAGQEGWREMIPKTRSISDDYYYMRLMFHEWYYGPFKSKEDLIDAIKWLYLNDPLWNYQEGVEIMFGSIRVVDKQKEEIFEKANDISDEEKTLLKTVFDAALKSAHIKLTGKK
jgi:hypothetical protein